MSAEQQDWTDYFKRVQQARRAVRNLKGWPHFSHVFMVSALSGDGIADLKVKFSPTYNLLPNCLSVKQNSYELDLHSLYVYLALVRGLPNM